MFQQSVRCCKLLMVMYAGDDPTLINKLQDPYFLDQIAQTYKDISTTIKSFSPGTGAWVSEGGGAYHSGGDLSSNTFVNGFWSVSLHTEAK